MTESTPASTPRRSRWTVVARAVAWLLALVPSLLFLVLAWKQRWMSDDGFINLRVVHNFVRGHGLVFNLGERVESFTSALWVFVLSLAGVLRIPLEHAAVVLGIVLALVGLVLAQLGCFQAWSEDKSPKAIARSWAVPLGAGTFAALPPAWDHASAGLELGLVMAYLGLGFWLTVRAANRDRSRTALPWATALVLGLGPLVRPELALFTIGMTLPLALVVLRRPRGTRLRGVLALLLAVAALPVLYQIFRMGYFAALTPNTALAKESMVSNWEQGAHYFQNFFGLYHVLFPVGLLLLIWVLLVAHWFRRENLALIAAVTMPLLVGAAHCFYVVKLGGDFMHARMFLPGLFSFVMPMALVPIRTGMPAVGRSVVAAAGVATAIWMVLIATLVRVDRENFFGIGDERGWYARSAGVDNPVRVDDYSAFAFHANGKRLLDVAARGERVVVVDEPSAGRLQPAKSRLPLAPDVLPESTRVVALRGALGIVGYAAGPSVHVVDLHGLSDPIAARLVLVGRGRPGHEKRLSNYWFVARYAAATEQDDLRVTVARDALGCGKLAEVLSSVSEPLTVKRFFSNIAAAFRLQAVRVPPDPYAARDQFCGAR